MATDSNLKGLLETKFQLSNDSIPDERHTGEGSQVTIEILDEETYKVMVVAAAVMVQAAGLGVMVVVAAVVEVHLVVAAVV